jgi:putative inorganic carbon (HCO3(-)) transporter
VTVGTLPRPWPGLLAIFGLASIFGALTAIAPLYALAGVVGLAFVVLVMADLTIGLCLFCVVAFLETLPGLEGLSVAKAAGIILTVSWLARIVTRRDSRQDFASAHPAITYVAILFLAWAATSALWAKDTGEVANAILRYGPNIFLLPIAYTALRRREGLLAVVSVFVASALLSALYGLATGNADPTDGQRLSGAGTDPNELAVVLLAAAALAFALAAVRSIPTLGRVAAAAASVLCVFLMLLTSSRTGLVGGGALLLMGMFFAGRGRHVPFLLLGLLAALSVGYYIAALAPQESRDRILAITEGGGSGRDDIWKVGWRMVEANPVKGVGVGNFPSTAVDYLLQPGVVTRRDLIVDNPKVAHNVYLEVLAELGVIGLTLFLVIVGFVLSCALRAARLFAAHRDAAMEIVARSVLVASVGVLVASSFVSLQFSKPLWLLFGLAPALLALAHYDAPRLQSPLAAPARAQPGDP